MSDKIRYSGVVLDDDSQGEAVAITRQYIEIPENWEIIAHHMTINLGGLPDEKKSLIGTRVVVPIDGIGKSDLAIALRVANGFAANLSTNSIPHITIAVNRGEGGKPFHSNLIQEWENTDLFALVGFVEEIS